MMDKELFDINDELGLTIKKNFEEEFDINDISVSDDLISKTMAAIKLKAGEGSEEESNSRSEENQNDAGSKAEADNITRINTPKKNKMIWKWASGIAAALFLGVVVLFVAKIGVGGYKNEATKSASIAYDSAISENSVRTETAAAPENQPESAVESVAEDKVNASQSIESYDGPLKVTASAGVSEINLKDSENYDSIKNFEKNSLKADNSFQNIVTDSPSKADESYDASSDDTSSSDGTNNEDRSNTIGSYGTGSDFNGAQDSTAKNDSEDEPSGSDDEHNEYKEETGNDLGNTDDIDERENIEAAIEKYIALFENARESIEAEEIDYSRLLDSFQTTEIYSLLLSDRDYSLERLTEIREQSEDELEKQFIDVIIADIKAADTSNR